MKKTCIYILITKFALAGLVASTVALAADTLVIPDADKWQKSLAEACESSAVRNKTQSRVADIKKTCACVARNTLELAANEETIKDAEDDLKWNLRFYKGQIRQAELSQDPLFIAEFVFHFAEACIENPNYKHQFGPPQ